MPRHVPITFWGNRTASIATGSAFVKGPTAAGRGDDCDEFHALLALCYTDAPLDKAGKGVALENVESGMIFIVGVGRSGTSLLQSMLHAHPDICFLPETAIIRRYLASGVLRRQLGKYGKQAVVDHLAADERLKRLGLPQAHLRDAVPQQPEQFAALYPRLMDAFIRARGQFRYVGDKDPRNSEYLPWIREHYKRAWVIHIFRDPRDVLASKRKAAWSRGRHWLAHVFANRVQFILAMNWGMQLFGDRFLSLAYEDLIARPEEQLRRICAFLELPFNEEMLAFAEASRELVAEDEMAWKGETMGPLRAENSGSWVRQLSPAQSAACEVLCGPTMVAGGYARLAPWYWRALMALMWLPFQLGTVVYRKRRQWSQR